ncbi:HNH endonuclease [Sanguibacter keddieii DSM 10542]|uniref:HNH endonuclease n=1 Tax=Sanguibacter keddieii (strain ATCC 51767 / DSM 10542 / NCFB 3025 / ST-74) TaxID=446469 RepID=D1BGH7_SANKS|nr:HNH endonuclease signature motif containing protein [Sanguibacter keddieii]ACZ21554.1 HNH endonuclease [Sanguibacter keddieii DSM 10542]
MTPAEAGEGLAVLVDAVVAIEAEIAALSARRAALVDRARRWSREATDAVARGRGEDRAPFLDHRLAERSLVSEIACALRLPERSAGALLIESQALVHEHPATMAALREGVVSYRRAQTLLDATMGLDEPSVLELDALLAQKALTLTVSRLKTVARRERERRDSRPLVERHQVAAQDRHVELHPCGDGMAWLHHLLPAVQATAIFHRLTDIATAVQGPDEPRTLAQLRADASVDPLLDDDARAALMAAPCDAEQPPAGETPTGGSGKSASASTGTGTGTGRMIDSSAVGTAVMADTADHHTAGGPTQSIAGIADRVSLGGIKPQVAVTIPVMTLLGHSDEPGDLAGHGPIDAHTARRLAAQAPSFLRILTHPETGTVLSVGRDRYAVPADLKSWLRIRDETCRFPGCSRRAQRCDIDHIKDWAHGGTTDHHNLIHLCRNHHRLKHTTSWTVRTEPPGVGTGPPGTGSRTPGGSSTGPPARKATSPPDGPSSGRDSPHRARAHDGVAPSADIVHWTAPSGRTYLDHAATTITQDQGRTADERGRAPAGGDPSPFPDEPPF